MPKINIQKTVWQTDDAGQITRPVKKIVPMRIEDVDIDSIMSKAVLTGAVGHWCDAIVPVVPDFHPEVSRHTAKGKALIFQFIHPHKGKMSETLTKQAFLKGLKIWLEKDVDDGDISFGTLKHTLIGYAEADRIIQYALFKDIQFERKM